MDWQIGEWRVMREGGIPTEIILIGRQMASDSEREGRRKAVIISTDEDAFERIPRI